jgi:type III restriction enzyme
MVSHLIETKGLEDDNFVNKDRAAKIWCKNATMLTEKQWSYLKVPQAEYERLQPTLFSEVVFLASK